MYCKYCGSQIADDSQFCSNCGRDLMETTPVQGATVPDKTDSWYYRDDYGKRGHYSYKEIVGMINNRVIDIDAEVKPDRDDAEWIPITQSAFAATINNVPPRKVHISDGWLWCLAVLPMLVSIILEKIGFANGIDIFAAIILNLVFLYLDMNVTHKADVHEKYWTLFGILIVPLYIIAREIKTNHNFAPAVLNIFLIVADLLIL